MSIPAQSKSQLYPHKGRQSMLLRKSLLVALFLVLLTDMTPGLRVGIMPGLSGKNLLLYIVVFTILVRVATDSKGIRFSDLDVHAPFILMIVYAMFTIVIASMLSPAFDMRLGIVSLKNQVADLFLFMFVFRYGLEHRQDFLSILRFVIVTMLIMSIVTLIDFLNIPDLGLIGTHKGRIEGPFGEANQYGALLVFLLPISIAAVSPELRSWKKGLWWFGILVMGVLLVATGSRGALVALVSGSAIGAFILRRYVDIRQVARIAAAFLGVFLVVIVIFTIFNPEFLLERFEKTTSANIYVASSGRLEIWTAAILVMLEWPWSFLVGNGWNSYAASGIWKSAHSEYVDRLYELGVIGLSLFIALLYQITTRARRRLATADPELRRIIIGYVFSMSTVVVSIFFVELPDPWTIIWVITGLVMGLQAMPATDSAEIDHRNGAPVE